MTEFARDLIIEQLARLRLACVALNVQPEDVRLEDLIPEVAEELRQLARLDYLTLIQPAKEGKSC